MCTCAVRGESIRIWRPFPATLFIHSIQGLSICNILLHTLLSERSELSPCKYYACMWAPPVMNCVYCVFANKTQDPIYARKFEISVILNNAHRIFSGWNFTHVCISYGNAYPINARNSIFMTTQARFIFFFLACVLLEFVAWSHITSKAQLRR